MIKKYLIITGAAGFVGEFLSENLIKENFGLILVDKNRKKLVKLKNKIKKINKISSLYIFDKDITKENNLKKILNFVKKKKIFIYSLINNAAIDAKPKKNKISNKYLTKKEWDSEIAVGLTGSYLMIKYFGEHMYHQKNGKIINIGSDLSVISPNQEIYKKSYKNFYKPASYSVIKHGLLGLTKYFSTFFAASGITCNMISPGPILNDQSKTLVKNIKKITPMKRLANRSDLLGMIKFLLSGNSRFITGQNIVIDGGRTII